MNMSLKHWIVISSVIALTACNQPAPKAEQAPTPPASATDPHAGHEMSHMASTTAQSQPAHIADYMQMMTTMHDQMSHATAIANPDVAFATGMIAHHQGAIDMANIQLKYGKDSQMRTLAETIIKAQQAEITQMQTWLTKHKDDPAPANASAKTPEMDMNLHNAMMQGTMDSDPDIAFAKGMIPHHQGAIQMADIELKTGKDKEMQDLAKRIKSAQDPEIKQMQAWLAGKGVK